MKELKIAIGGIPAIVWGEPSEKVYIHVHGKMSCKEYARAFAETAEKKGYQTISDRNIEKCLFQSPIVDMEYLIRQMFLWFQVTEERLCIEKEIPTPVDTLRWDYYQYVREHPVCDWRIPTAILYGGKDNMQSAEVIRNFAQRYSCDLTISQDSEHAFMQDNDKSIVEKWLEKNI